MIVHVHGKQHFSGVSRKSGNSYDFWTVFVSYPSAQVEGEKTDSVNLPGSLDASKLLVNQYYNFDFDMSGRLSGFVPVKV